MQRNVYANLKRELSEIKELLEGLDDRPSSSKLDGSSGEISASSISQDIAGIRDAIESLKANEQSKSDEYIPEQSYTQSILSPEDTRIMGLVATGLSNNDIAAEMDCSVSKIEKRMTAMFKEARVRKRVDLVEWWQMNQ